MQNKSKLFNELLIPSHGRKGLRVLGDPSPLSKWRDCPQFANGANEAQRDSVTCLGHRKASVGFSEVLFGLPV